MFINHTPKNQSYYRINSLAADPSFKCDSTKTILFIYLFVCDKFVSLRSVVDYVFSILWHQDLPLGVFFSSVIFSFLWFQSKSQSIGRSILWSWLVCVCSSTRDSASQSHVAWIGSSVVWPLKVQMDSLMCHCSMFSFTHNLKIWQPSLLRSMVPTDAEMTQLIDPFSNGGLLLVESSVSWWQHQLARVWFCLLVSRNLEFALTL